MKEVQTLLLRFGFNPGPVDGAAGRLTEAAVSKYQEARALPPTGKSDRALLDQLREDPAPKVDPPPQVAQRAQRRDPQPQPQPQPQQQRRASDPLEFLRTADGNITRWLNSLSH